MKTKHTNELRISRKQALKKLTAYSKYTALTALGTYLFLNPRNAQAQSPDDPGDGFTNATTFNLNSTSLS
ncbi:hypothetical protein TPENAI_50087 [Tenacibaculum litopenaei]|uniref:hypothetical protein n=1 Tax=Tenacibaculum litopenaei TaxID=396016 RepID=UPI0038960245